VRPLPKNTHCPKNTQCKLILTMLHTPSAGRSDGSLLSPSPQSSPRGGRGPQVPSSCPTLQPGLRLVPPRQPSTATSPPAKKHPWLHDPPETFTHLQRSVHACSSNLLSQLLLITRHHLRLRGSRGSLLQQALHSLPPEAPPTSAAKDSRR